MPRYLGCKDPQLICSCDASEKAYTTAVYLKTTHKEKSDVNFVFFQSKRCTKEINVDSTPPADSITYRSEKFKLHFKAVRNGESCKKIIWTDSQCVLNWIKSMKLLSVFVQNRLKEITSDESIQFHYINTKENPADLATRGLSSQVLKESTLWWKAPDWLKKDESSWPTWNVPPVNNYTLQDI